MAELSTIARPYAQGFIKALTERNAGAEEVTQALDALDALALIAQDPQAVSLVGNPKLTDDQLFDMITAVSGGSYPKEVVNLLRVVIENGRLDALPEIAAQCRELNNLSEGIADAYIETAFELSQAELDSLLESLTQKFPGMKLHPIVTVNPELIGGVRIRVGDKLLDGSIRIRLAQMQTMLTA